MYSSRRRALTYRPRDELARAAGGACRRGDGDKRIENRPRFGSHAP